MILKIKYIHIFFLLLLSIYLLSEGTINFNQLTLFSIKVVQHKCVNHTIHIIQIHLFLDNFA